MHNTTTLAMETRIGQPLSTGGGVWMVGREAVVEASRWVIVCQVQL
jgi:hypothetical protein